MAETETPFYTQTAVLDTYLKANVSSLPSKVIDLLAKTLRLKSEFYTYFFRNRPHSSWAKELLSRGYFEDAPALVKSGSGLAVPRWEEQEYLISISKEVPEVVLEHTNRLKGHGYYHERAITGLKTIPLEMIEKVIPLILVWLSDGKVAPYISLEVLSLIKILAEGGNELAFQLFQKVTVPQPSGDTRTIEGFAFNSRALALFQFDDYDQRTIESTSSVLQKLNAKKTISILETQLCEALRIEAEATNDTNYKSYTFWRSTIEDSGQDILDYYKDRLLMTLRDTLEATINDNTQNLTAFIEKYLYSDYTILRRLGLYILSRFPEKLKNQVKREILKLENLEDIEIHHEHFALIESGFPQLGSSERDQFFNAVIIGPSQDRLDRLYKLDEDESEEKRREYLDRYAKSWIRDRLWMLKDYLGGEQKELLNSLVEELGKPEHPDFTHWASGAYFVSDVSPLTADDLKIKSNEELLEYLKNWKPDGENFGPERESYGALGQELAKLILNDLERYKPIVYEIASLHAGFATPLINIPILEGGDFESITELRLSICEYLLNNEQFRTSLDELPSGRWVSVRFVTVDMIEKFFGESSVKLSELLLIRARNLLVRLADDPDPDMESDRPGDGWFGNNDPITVAINHVRSKAVLSLIFYAQHVIVEKEKDKTIETKRELVPVVEGVLTYKVCRQNDFSLAVHSVFGEQLNRLYWIDKKWVEDNLDEIFPVDDDEESISFYVAAWDSYVVSPHPIFQELFALLRTRYERAIENLSRGYLTKSYLEPVGGLAQHLLLEYELNKYQINTPAGRESLIVKFFNEVSPEHRSTAVRVLNKRTHQNKENWQLAKEIWLWRLEEASNAKHNIAFKSEMEAFSYLLSAAPKTEDINTLWSLLEGFLPYIDDLENRIGIWWNVQKYLAIEVECNPSEAIRFYSLMHDKLSNPRFYYEEEAYKIIRYGITDKRSRQDTLLLVDKLFRRGSHEFRDIIERALEQSE